MELYLSSRYMWEEDVEGAVILCFEGEVPPEEAIGDAFREGRFSGKKGEVYSFDLFRDGRKRRVILSGLGKRAELDIRRSMEATGLAISEGCRLRVGSLHVSFPPLDDPLTETMVRGIAEGALLSLYRFSGLKTEEEEERRVERVAIGLPERTDLQGALEEGMVLGQETNYVRDLVNSPGNRVTPSYLAEEARRIARDQGLSCRVLGRDEIEGLGMGAFLSVARGSEEPPFFIILEYRGSGGAPVVLVGKAITFDSGGISLKPGKDMDRMKYDMSGGGAVLGTMKAVSRMGLKVNLVGLIPATENLPSGRASRPGDVVRSMSGKTVEIISTDAEGRMTLCDALHYGKGYNPRAMVDIATLTGACLIALGREAIGLMGNDEGLIGLVKEAGRISGERVWELPLWEEYEDLVKSDVADIKNVGDRTAGTIVGGIFLKRFVGDIPWVHLDIAGTAWAEKERPCQPKGATGVGVRLLYHLLRTMEEG